MDELEIHGNEDLYDEQAEIEQAETERLYKEVHESAGELEQADADAKASPDDYGDDE